MTAAAVLATAVLATAVLAAAVLAAAVLAAAVLAAAVLRAAHLASMAMAATEAAMPMEAAMAVVREDHSRSFDDSSERLSAESGAPALMNALMKNVRVRYDQAIEKGVDELRWAELLCSGWAGGQAQLVFAPPSVATLPSEASLPVNRGWGRIGIYRG